MMNKKYTKKEFEEMFEEAVIKATESLLNEYKNASKDEVKNPMMGFAFTMQNTLAYAELHKILFKEDK